MRVAVIGAGPAGMTAAYQLVKGGAHVDVYEAGPAVGGMSRTIELWNQKVDLGPHRFFSSDRVVNELWLEVVGRDYEMVKRCTHIYYGGKFYSYPLKPLDAFAKLGPTEAVRCVASYVRQKTRAQDDDGSFEAWVVSRFGRRLFDIFFRTYSEKLWGISCRELDADFAAQRIKKLDLSEAVKNALLAGRGNQHKTLVDEFAYPLGGTGMVYERMAARVRDAGSRVLLETPIRAVTVEGGVARGIELKNGERRSYDRVISSMPLTRLVQSLDGVSPEALASSQRLEFRNTILVYLRVAARDLFPDNWLYVHAPELQTGRVTNFRNWTPSLYGKESDSILALEYWCNPGDPLWSASDAELIALATRELGQTGLSQGAPVTAGHVQRVPRCYPVYRRGYKGLLEPIVDHLRTISGLEVIGRYGAFKYNNQDHSILMGIYAAENVLRGAGHDLWSINSDYESYQEATVVTATGLSPVRNSRPPRKGSLRPSAPPSMRPPAAPPA